jgi:hypothetical protein
MNIDVLRNSDLFTRLFASRETRDVPPNFNARIGTSGPNQSEGSNLSL